MIEGCVSEADEDWGKSTRFRAVNPTVQHPAAVSRSLIDQPILNKREQLSIDMELTKYLSLGDQCRIVRNNGNVALYTVGEVRNENSSKRVRMGMAARSRLGTSDTFTATLQTAVVAEGLSDAQAEAQDEFVERLVDDGEHTGLVVLAPHGGLIEPHTDKQAELVQLLLADKRVSSWICKGYQSSGAYDQWHITSTALSRNSFPGLNQIADRGFAYAVSFHGLGEPVVLIGGGGPLELKQEIHAAICVALEGAAIEVSIAEADDLYGGDSPDNVVNWLTANGTGGIQIEQGQQARESHGLAIALAVAGVFAQRI